MEEIYEVKPIGIKYVCDTCKKGDMLPTGKNVWSADPPEFEHSCTNCGHKESFTEKYPLIRFVKNL